MRNKQYFSHYGEDVVLDYLFNTQEKGVYVDVGCYHPSLFSNTKKLYDRGWRGINIDANATSIALFNQSRPNDINLNLGITENIGEAEYFKFLEIDAFGGGSGNSLSRAVCEEHERNGFTTSVYKIQTDTLASIHTKHLAGRKIDFLNVDVEGLDLAVLKSNDWNLFRPRLIAVEIWSKDIDFDNPMKNETYSFLRAKNYKLFSVTIYTSLFYDANNGFNL